MSEERNSSVAISSPISQTSPGPGLDKSKISIASGQAKDKTFAGEDTLAIENDYFVVNVIALDAKSLRIVGCPNLRSVVSNAGRVAISFCHKLDSLTLPEVTDLTLHQVGLEYLTTTAASLRLSENEKIDGVTADEARTIEAARNPKLLSVHAEKCRSAVLVDNPLLHTFAVQQVQDMTATGSPKLPNALTNRTTTQHRLRIVGDE